MGDEFVAAGGFDSLWGNNKAISAARKVGERRGKNIREEDINHSFDSYSFLLEK